MLGRGAQAFVLAEIALLLGLLRTGWMGSARQQAGFLADRPLHPQAQ